MVKRRRGGYSARPPPLASPALDAILTSLGLVFVAELGDKTQILALLLAARLRQPWTILGGMVLAVAANHLLAGGIGIALAQRMSPQHLRWVLALAFLAMAAWLLIPDKVDTPRHHPRERNVFLTALAAFFLAEMGDKTQIATVALAARFHSLALVMVGSTLGILAADAPVIWFGERITRRLPGVQLRRISAALFAGFGAAILAGW